MFKALFRVLCFVWECLRSKNATDRNIPSNCPHCGSEMVRAPSIAANVHPDMVIRGQPVGVSREDSEVCLACNYNCR